MQRYKDDCVLCRELNGSKETNFHVIYGEQYSRKLAETDNFILIPALGQLTENQSMIIPKKHYLSMKEAIQDFSEIQSLIDYYKNIFLSDEEEIMIFENGNSRSTQSSCIEHAHLNLLPIGFDFIQRLSQFFGTDEKLSFSSDLEQLYIDISLDRTYRVAGTFSSGFYTIYLNQKAESQFMRKELAKLFQRNKWDWKSFGFQSSLLKLLNTNKGFHE